MSIYIYITIISMIIHFVLIVPFINLLYKKRFRRADQNTTDAFDKPTPIFDQYHRHKSGTPVGGGMLIVGVSSALMLFFLGAFSIFGMHTQANYPSAIAEIMIILFTFVSFALLGVYDDLNKMFFWEKKKFFGMRLRMKLFIEILLAVIIATMMYGLLGIQIIHIPFLGVFEFSYFYILFAAFVIVAFANAVNITDGLDGLASGVLMITLFGFWTIARTIIDVPLSIFIAVWIGGLLAFLYFNIYPARIFLGDTGALSFGATFAVIGLLLGKAFALPVIGGIFVIEIATSLVQLLSKRFRHKKAMPAAPLHLYFQSLGWEEPKIVMRFWIGAVVCVLFGLMVAFMK